MAELEKQFDKLKAAIKTHEAPNGPVVSAYIVGSFARGNADRQSDLDILILTDDNASGESIGLLGESLHNGLNTSLDNQPWILIESPTLNRPDLIPHDTTCVQIILHKASWAIESIRKRNWVFVNWANCNYQLSTTSLLPSPVIPELNASLLDEFDGLPSLIRKIDVAIIVYSNCNRNDIIQLYERMSKARLNEIFIVFPDVANNVTRALGGIPDVPDELPPISRLLAIRNVVMATIKVIAKSI